MRAHPSRARLLVVLALALASLFCAGMLAARPFVVGRVGHVYLAWNLVLAWLPFLLAMVLYDRQKRGRGGGGQVVLFAAWLSFLPNAPYIVTDLIHLPDTAAPPLWFDTSLYLAFAWTGLMLGLVSLYLVHSGVRARYGEVRGWMVVGTATALSGLGVYLGRFLRWNSWDIVTHPLALLGDLWGILTNPGGRPLAVTALFGAFVAVTYLGVYAFAELRAGVAAPRG